MRFLLDEIFISLFLSLSLVDFVYQPREKVKLQLQRSRPKIRLALVFLVGKSLRCKSSPLADFNILSSVPILSVRLIVVCKSLGWR